MPIVLAILKVAFPAETAAVKRRLECAEQLAALYRAVMDWDASTKVSACDAVRKFVIKYCELQQMYSDNLIHKITPRFHILLHCVERLDTAGSLQRSWCYADERAIGKAVKIAAKLHPKTVSKELMQRFRSWQLLE